MRTLQLPGNRLRAATLVESALCLNLTMFLLLGIIVGGIAISRYQTVVLLAEELARAGSVRGATYREGAGLAVGTTTDWAEDLYSSGAARFPSRTTRVNVSDLGLDPTNLRVSFTWSNDDNSVVRVNTDRGTGTGNTLQVRVEYDWTGDFFPGATFVAASKVQIIN